MGEHTFDGSGAEVMARVVELSELLAGSRLMWLSAIAELDFSGSFAADGYTSTTAFLMHRCGMSARDARRQLFLARSLCWMGYSVKSAYAGHISMSQLEILAHARHRHPEPYADDETSLVEAVSGLGVSETRRVVGYWTQAHDHWESIEEDVEPSWVYLSKTWQRRSRLDGDLDPESSEVLNTALDALMGEIVEHTPREELGPASVRRAEAHAELARRFLDSSDSPTDHGSRPHLTVLVDWNTLTGKDPDGRSELLDGTVITPGDARRLACDAQVCRLLTGPQGEILDLGRTTRTVTPAQWKALRVRDRHCQWWGCRRPAAWCDGHHTVFWADQEASHRPRQPRVALPLPPHLHPPARLETHRHPRQPHHHPPRRDRPPQRTSLAGVPRSKQTLRLEDTSLGGALHFTRRSACRTREI